MDSLKTGIGIKKLEPGIGNLWLAGGRGVIEINTNPESNPRYLKCSIVFAHNCNCFKSATVVMSVWKITYIMLVQRGGKKAPVSNILKAHTCETAVKRALFSQPFFQSQTQAVFSSPKRGLKGTRAELRLLGPCLALMCGLHFTIISPSTCYWCSMYGLYKGCLQVIPSFFTQTRNWILLRCIGLEDWAHEHYFNILFHAEFWI